MLCQPNNDITNNALFTACIAACESKSSMWL